MLSSRFTGPDFIKRTSYIYNFVLRKNNRNATETTATNQQQKLNVYTSEAKPAILNTTPSAIFWECYLS